MVSIVMLTILFSVDHSLCSISFNLSCRYHYSLPSSLLQSTNLAIFIFSCSHSALSFSYGTLPDVQTTSFLVSHIPGTFLRSPCSFSHLIRQLLTSLRRTIAYDVYFTRILILARLYPT